jgi:hypothetical protein
LLFHFISDSVRPLIVVTNLAFPFSGSDAPVFLRRYDFDRLPEPLHIRRMRNNSEIKARP